MTLALQVARLFTEKCIIIGNCIPFYIVTFCLYIYLYSLITLLNLIILMSYFSWFHVIISTVSMTKYTLQLFVQVYWDDLHVLNLHYMFIFICWYWLQHDDWTHYGYFLLIISTPYIYLLLLFPSLSNTIYHVIWKLTSRGILLYYNYKA